LHTPTGFSPAHALPAALAPTAYAFAFVEARLLTCLHADGSPAIPTLLQLQSLAPSRAKHYLGELEGRPCIAVDVEPAGAAPEGWQASGLRALFFRLPDPLLALAARAYQVVEWDRTHRFCGHCGTPMRDRAGERARECPACALVAYPRVSPAMMALVIRDRRILLARAPRFPGSMYSALAGFVEPGETIEDCVRREVREEVGIAVDRLEYFGSQSWAVPHSLMIAFTAHWAGGDLTPDPAEIADAQWFELDALPELPSPVSIARHLIDATVTRLRQAARTPGALE
jgi:NAD+ diphosphatase